MLFSLVQFSCSVMSNCLRPHEPQHSRPPSVQFSSVQSLSRVQLFAILWIAVRQASLFITISWSSLRLMSIESVMPSSHLILSHPLLLLPPIPPCPLCWWCHPTISSSVISFSSCPQSFQASGSFEMSQLSRSGGQSIGVSASTSVLPLNTQDWSPLAWT